MHTATSQKSMQPSSWESNTIALHHMDKVRTCQTDDEMHGHTWWWNICWDL